MPDEPDGAEPLQIQEQGSQGNRALLTALSLLLAAAAVQITAAAPSPVRWLTVATLLLLASISAFLVAAKLAKLDPKLLRDIVNDRDTIPSIVSYYATRSALVTAAAGLTLLAGAGLSAYWSYHLWRPPVPGGAFAETGTGVLSSSSGEYLIGLDNVQNVPSKLVWFELAVPEYRTRYAQAYLYYYTQASPQFGSPNSYEAVVDIANYGKAPTTDVITALACDNSDTSITAGSSHPEIRKDSGCENISHICIGVPSACEKSSSCHPPKHIFTVPPECNNQSRVWLRRVAALAS